MGFLPASWSEDLRLFAALMVVGLAVLLVLVVLARLTGRRVPETAAAEAALEATKKPLVTVASALAKVAAPRGSRAPDLDPEEWVSGNVIHLDRYKSVGLIRCDRVKSPVQFKLANGRVRPPRVGEKVRFKGRHGARRKPVADVVELAS